MTTAEVRDWGLYGILAITHKLPATWDVYADVLEFVTGSRPENGALALGPHEAARGWLLELHPQLAGITEPVPGDDAPEAAMDAWADRQADRFGAVLPIRPMPPERRIDPLERVMDLAGPEKVWLIDPDLAG